MTDTAIAKHECTSTREHRVSYVQPLTNIYKEGETILLDVCMPGITKENIGLQAENGVLSITGDPISVDAKYSKREFGQSGYRRTFRLPEDVDHSLISAAYSDGLLRVSLPRKEAAKKRSIAVQ